MYFIKSNTISHLFIFHIHHLVMRLIRVRIWLPKICKSNIDISVSNLFVYSNSIIKILVSNTWFTYLQFYIVKIKSKCKISIVLQETTAVESYLIVSRLFITWTGAKDVNGTDTFTWIGNVPIQINKKVFAIFTTTHECLSRVFNQKLF